MNIDIEQAAKELADNSTIDEMIISGDIYDYRYRNEDDIRDDAGIYIPEAQIVYNRYHNYYIKMLMSHRIDGDYEYDRLSY